MTTAQALTAVEQALTSLGLRNRWGDLLEGIMAAGHVARFHGQRWEQLVDAFEGGQVTPAEYAVRACDMIYEFRKARKIA